MNLIGYFLLLKQRIKDLLKVRYRIVTDGDKYRVQKRGSWFFFKWVFCLRAHWYLTKSHVWVDPVEFSSVSKAYAWITSEIKKNGLKKEWEPVPESEIHPDPDMSSLPKKLRREISKNKKMAIKDASK